MDALQVLVIEDDAAMAEMYRLCPTKVAALLCLPDVANSGTAGAVASLRATTEAHSS
jgi:hypothetical protein